MVGIGQAYLLQAGVVCAERKDVISSEPTKENLMSLPGEPRRIRVDDPARAPAPPPERTEPAPERKPEKAPEKVPEKVPA